MADLKTDYKDDVLDTSQNTKRKYQMIDNGDGTVSFEDVTEYLQQGDSFGADDINDTNEKVNIINDNLTAMLETYTNLYTSSTEVSETVVAIDSHVDDYKFILVCQKFVLGFRNVSLIPRALFENTSYIWISSLDVSNFASCKYEDNTHLRVRSVGGGITVFGIK